MECQASPPRASHQAQIWYDAKCYFFVTKRTIRRWRKVHTLLRDGKRDGEHLRKDRRCILVEWIWKVIIRTFFAQLRWARGVVLPTLNLTNKMGMSNNGAWVLPSKMACSSHEIYA